MANNLEYHLNELLSEEVVTLTVSQRIAVLTAWAQYESGQAIRDGLNSVACAISEMEVDLVASAIEQLGVTLWQRSPEDAAAPVPPGQ